MHIHASWVHMCVHTCTTSIYSCRHRPDKAAGKKKTRLLEKLLRAKHAHTTTHMCIYMSTHRNDDGLAKLLHVKQRLSNKDGSKAEFDAVFDAIDTHHTDAIT